MPKNAPSRYVTFIIAVSTSNEAESDSPSAIYAVVKQTADEALAAVSALSGPDAKVQVAGSLSARTARAMKLKPDAIRQL